MNCSLNKFANPIFDEDCEDVDECNETDPALVHDCDPNATCSNIGRDSQNRLLTRLSF